MEKIQLGTPDGTAENVDRLAELFPQAVTEVEADDGSITRAIDFDALRDLLGDVAEGTRERYQFTWPGKAEAKAEARRPIAKTMRPEKGKSKDWDTTQNLYIEGDNLDALKILKETYAGKVKLIYIDPPYNTGHDFVYDDDFAKTRGEYTLESGDYDEDGGRLVANTEGNGRFHSDWCSMMYPRLILARELLHSRGCICISIDDNEVCALKSICNEIFGERSFVCTIPRQARASVQNDTDISVNHEYILIYARCRRQTNRRLKESNASDWMLDKSFACYPKTSDESRYANPDNDPRGPWKADPFDAPNVRPNLTYPIVNPNTGEAHLPPSGRCWRTEPEKYQQLLSDGRIIFGASGKKRPQLKVFLEEKRDYGEVDNTWWDASRIQTNAGASKDLMKLFDGELPFNTPKPVSLILNLINLGLPPDSEDIVLDFFSGSASTAHAVMLENSLKKKRIRYILIQLPEPHDGSFNSLCDVGEERIRRAGEKIRAKVERSRTASSRSVRSPSVYPTLVSACCALTRPT